MRQIVTGWAAKDVGELHARWVQSFNCVERVVGSVDSFFFAVLWRVGKW
jgi:hypothetical protein